MTPQRLLLFGDQTAEKTPSLRQLLRLSHNSHALRRFLRESTDVLQNEVRKLRPESRNWFPAFDDLLSLAERCEKEDDSKAEAIMTPLITIVRLAELILHVENEPAILDSSFSQIHILGLCTGLIPSAAAACSKAGTELHQIALELVAISVRLGDAIVERSRAIDSTLGTWAYSIVGATAAKTQVILDQFHKARDIPKYRRAFVAVTSRTWVTVSGPPSTLAALWLDSPELALAPRMKLAANAAVHASHLSPLDADAILGHSTILNAPCISGTRILSTSTFRLFQAHDLRSLLTQMLPDITQNTLCLTETVKSLTENILAAGKEVEIVVVGPTAHTKMLENALQEVSIKIKRFSELATKSTTQPVREGSGKIAIVGMSGRFPGSESLAEFWENLKEGKDFHEKVPSSRFNLNDHYDPSTAMKSSMTTEHGCFLREPGLFDCRLFNISPREAIQMDPVQRLLLMTSYEALEMAGYAPGRTPSSEPKRLATYMAQTTDDWRENNQCAGVDIYYVPGIVRAFTPGRINYHFKWEGASHSVDAACSGSSTAVQLACRALLARECDTALAGGGQVNTAPAAFAGCGRGGFLSPTGQCKTFHDDADGYCRGEAAGVVVLKRLEDAIGDNDNVIGIVDGSLRTYSAKAASITQPHGESQVNILQTLMREAGKDPKDISYVEMHGTGTQAGDYAEMKSVAEVFGPTRTAGNPLTVGAVKANVGHSEAGAGITSLIKCILILQNGGKIPPQPGMPFKLNHRFPALNKMHIKIAGSTSSNQSRPSVTDRVKVLLNNFDASGGNTCLLLEQGPVKQPKPKDPRIYHTIVCSARTSRSLRGNLQRLLEFLKKNEETRLSDIAYSSTSRRMQETLRVSYVARSIKELKRHLAMDLQKDTNLKAASSGPRTPVVFAFPGQGSFTGGVASKLFESCPRFHDNILLYQNISEYHGFPNIIDLIAQANVELETKTIIQVQLALIFLELALADLWRSWGIIPDLVIGHSIGEYSALCVAGVLSVSDTIYLVGQRAKLMETKCAADASAMLAINGPVESISDIITEEACEISCLNAPDMTILGGTKNILEKTKIKMQSAGMRTKFLPVSHAFHTSHMDPILGDLEKIANRIPFSAPQVPVASTLKGKIVREAGVFSPSYLVQHTRESVNFLEALQSIKAETASNPQTLWMEMGPEATCLGLIRSTLQTPPSTMMPSIKSNEDNWKTISTCASKLYTFFAPISWQEFHCDYLDALSLVQLPSYSFDLKDYWTVYEKQAPTRVLNQAKVEHGSTSGAQRGFLGLTCLQYVDEESYDNDRAFFAFSSYTAEPKLFKAIQGHLVDGTAICPASVFCDIALSAARYAYMTAKAGTSEPHMSIGDMQITHPVVVTEKNPKQVLRILVEKAGDKWSSVLVTFESNNGKADHDHGSCRVDFGADDNWKTIFSRTVPLVQRRMEDLKKSALAGQCHRLQRSVVYKLFANLVEYGEDYQGLQEVYMDDAIGDAVAEVKLEALSNAGEFTLSPYWMDSVVHLAGFVLNGNITSTKDIAFISAGFDSFHLFESLSTDKRYLSYVSIQPTDKKECIVTDVYLFEGNNLVALCAGLIFHKMSTAVMRVIFGFGDKPSSTLQEPRQPAIKVTNKVQRKVEVSSHTTETQMQHESQDKPTENNDKSAVVDSVLEIVATECGFALDDMEPTTPFADMGIDSLMSIAITSAVQKKTGVELGASFFKDNPLVEDLRQYLMPSDQQQPEDPINAPVLGSNIQIPDLTEDSSDAISSGAASPSFTPIEGDPLVKITTRATTPSLDGEISDNELEQIHKPDISILESQDIFKDKLSISPPKAEQQYESQPVLIRGRPTSGHPPLFLVADGAGSATAYIHIPRLSMGNAIYALESPFLHDPESYNCTVEEVCELYVTAIRRTSPNGPYLIGGWSAGAVYAYEVARQLLAQKETIIGLILIDMRVPRKMPDALEPSRELIASAGVFTGIERSGQAKSSTGGKMRDHLVSTVSALVQYDPVPLPPGNRPVNNFLIWAQKGLSETRKEDPFMTNGHQDRSQKVSSEEGNNMEDSDTGLKSWFYDARSVFGPNGWDRLLGDVECHVIEGADHFDMVTPPNVELLGKVLEAAVKKSMGSAT
ncbi:Type I Iterative PKS [Bacidia gigantensis]|uniref:Type I Iterative PKS n=1 Tax=Bacidia gigantensis TaxID=2732470 RepID=UPI001D0382D4|nr:Type I Iterative PKS [Bacidia gigantensis]KAG8531293.1 Type I Iterative PKS [Bacidia gigantensis]